MASLAAQINELFNPTPDDFENEKYGDEAQLLFRENDSSIQPDISLEGINRLRSSEIPSGILQRYPGKKIKRKSIEEKYEDENIDQDLYEDEDEVEDVDDGEQSERESEDELGQDDNFDFKSRYKPNLNDFEDVDEEEEEEGEEEEEEGGLKITSSGSQGLDNSKNSEMEKAHHTQTQKELYDNFLELRMKLFFLQRLANQLPEEEIKNFDHNENNDNDNMKKDEKNENENSKKKQKEQLLSNSLISLISNLLSLQRQIRRKNIVHYTKAGQSSNPKDEDTLKLNSVEECWNAIEDWENMFDENRNQIFDKWNEKTQLASSLAKKNLQTMNKSFSEQVSSILSDQQRLIQKTQVNRSGVTILGKRPTDTRPEEEEKYDENTELCESIYDDSDFYHLLVKEFIESEADPSVSLMLRKKANVKRKQGKTSKGRVLKHDVHEPLRQFMPLQIRKRPPFSENLFHTLFRS